MRKSIAVFSGIILTVTIMATAQMPRLLNYQGKLTTSLGVAVDGTRDFQFSLYTNASGGSSVWVEQQTGVQIQKGYYSVELGSLSAFPSTVDFLYGTWYLGICVRTNGAPSWGSELLPRTRILPGLLAFSIPPVLQQLTALSNQGLMASNLWQTSPLAGVPAGSYGKSNVFFVDRNGKYDFTDIQAALDRVASSNLPSATVYVLSGTYPISAPITFTPSGRILHNVSIIGDALTRPVIVTSFDDYALRADNTGTSPTNILLANISFGSSSIPLKRGVYWNAHKSKISNCTVYSSVSVKGNSNYVMNNYIENKSGDALSVEGLSNIVINNTLSGYNPSVNAFDIYTSVTSSNSTYMSNNLLAHGTVATPTNSSSTPGSVNYIVDANGRYDFDNIQSALEAVADGQATNNITNAVIRVYSGIYQISSPITLKANGKVLSNVTIISFDATAPQIIPSMNDFAIKIIGDSGNPVKKVILSNINIGTSSAPVSKGILVSNAVGCYLSNNAIFANNSMCDVISASNNIVSMNGNSSSFLVSNASSNIIRLQSATSGTIRITSATNIAFYLNNSISASIQNSDNCRLYSCNVSDFSNIVRCVISNANAPSYIQNISSNTFYNVSFSKLQLSNAKSNNFISCSISYPLPSGPSSVANNSGDGYPTGGTYSIEPTLIDDRCVTFYNSAFNTFQSTSITVNGIVSGFITGTTTGIYIDPTSSNNTFPGSIMVFQPQNGTYFLTSYYWTYSPCTPVYDENWNQIGCTPNPPTYTTSESTENNNVNFIPAAQYGINNTLPSINP